ncbi:MAG TPA: NAD(P)H-dependent oxidoreductase subunit E, partial [Bacteroidales bacterium]|nr:NAD(P)H-dependent oxidoreductase subunit E [Bacteroidales bacterium]
MKEKITRIIESFGNDAARLMDILSGVQSEFGCVSCEAVSVIAEKLQISEVDVKQTRSFYHFFTCEPVGKYAIYLNNAVVACMMGMGEIADEFEKQLGIKMGQRTADNMASLHFTACIGMSDQEPAAIINDVIFTSLTRDKVKAIVADMKAGKSVKDMVKETGDGNNANPLVHSMVKNNIKKVGPVVLDAYESGAGLSKALGVDSQAVIKEVQESGLRGRGGA